MGLYTIDDYYGIEFYNETLEALKNNSVEFKEYVSTKPPYQYWIECDEEPKWLNYEKASRQFSRVLVNVVRGLKPQDDYLFTRRVGFEGLKAVKTYAINDALREGEKTKEGVFFTANKSEVMNISKSYPRKIWYFGRHVNNKYQVFFADNLMIKNLIDQDKILVDGKGFKSITDLEIELNFNVFGLRDRLTKISETPYIQKNKFYQVSVRPELSSVYTLA